MSSLARPVAEQKCDRSDSSIDLHPVELGTQLSLEVLDLAAR